jgi:thiamine biosynthesis lipoprotein
MTPLQRWLLHISSALLVVSGLSYAIMKYLMVGDDPYSAVSNPMQPWALSVHVLSGPLAIFAIGWIFREHIAGRRRSKGSGLYAAALLVPMIASGYLLEVVTHESVKQALVVVHLVCGGLYAACYVAHIVRARRMAAVFAAVAIAAASSAPAAAPCEGVTRAREVMGSFARVVICEPDDEAAAAVAASAALDAFDRVDRLMSLYKPESDLSRLNRDGYPGPVALDRQLIELLTIAKGMTHETGGAFDVTIKPLMDHFGFYRELGFTAPAGGLSEALALVGADGLDVDAASLSAAFHRAAMSVDLGGIAKGYALDQAAAALRERGVRRAFLDLSRNLMFIGPGPLPGGLWPAAIASPKDPDGIAACIEVPEGSLSTSSLSGRMSGRVGHILDPRRGAIEGRVLQATVWSPSATRADALSTALLLLPEHDARVALAAGGEGAIVYRGRRKIVVAPMRVSACGS